MEHQPHERSRRDCATYGLRRCDVRDQREVDFRDRRRDRQADLAHRRGVGPRRGAAGVLRYRKPRRASAIQRQAVSHHARQPCPRPRHEDGQRGVEAEVRRPQRRLYRDERADHRERRADHRHGGWRVHDARISERLGSRDREEPVEALHGASAGRERLGDVAEGH